MTLSQYDVFIGGYHQSGNHWTLMVSCMIVFVWLYDVTLMYVHAKKCIKPKAALITYIDPKGENTMFINQLKKNWT